MLISPSNAPSPEQRAANLVRAIRTEGVGILGSPFRLVSISDRPCEDSVSPYVEFGLEVRPDELVTAELDHSFATAGWKKKRDGDWEGRIASESSAVRRRASHDVRHTRL
jgi:hypothetical protein